jgi:hypothetical protein
VNAGFFNRGTGDCVGNVMTHGHPVQVSGLQNTNFGMLAVRASPRIHGVVLVPMRG